jgi:hypothetical protein
VISVVNPVYWAFLQLQGQQLRNVHNLLLDENFLPKSLAGRKPSLCHALFFRKCVDSFLALGDSQPHHPAVKYQEVEKVTHQEN